MMDRDFADWATQHSTRHPSPSRAQSKKQQRDAAIAATQRAKALPADYPEPEQAPLKRLM